MQRMEQGQMFTNMAARRIQELGSELASLGVWSVGAAGGGVRQGEPCFGVS